jgi:hypothetical protein
LCDLHGDSAGAGKVTLEARENLTECPEAAREQTMRMPILGSSGARYGGRCQAVAFQDLNLLKIFPDYALSSAIKAWYKTGTDGCFCGFK